MVRRRLLGPLGVRLALAFLTVAISAIAVFAALTMLSARHEVSGLTDRNRADDLSATAVAAGEAYTLAGGWDKADLAGAAAVAARSQATLTVVNATGQVVAAPTDALARMMVQMHGMAAVDTPRGDPLSEAVIVDGVTVGAVMLRFPTQTMEAEQHVRDALARTALMGVLIASSVALVVALSVSVRVTRPVMALTTAAGDLAAGRRAARVETDGPGELRILAEAFNDMADNLDREDQLRRNLVADVAHELRTPLAILQGTTEALLDGIHQPTREVLGSLHDEVTRLRKLVADLETLAAAEAAGLRMHSDHTDLRQVATAATDLLRPLADEQELTVVTDMHSAPTIGDADRLQQVAVNLIANAIKFTPSGGTITIRTSVAAGSSVLEVSDTGPGIPADELAHVFDRFWRGTNGAMASGSGIGLAVVAELVKAHHGEVQATNNDTVGVRFTVSLPLDPHHQRPARDAPG
ncbi:MAG: ATP-binding protein [Actinomycetota bacterium]|nr:ATP-binding protein [Actinomycetota bacterium]